MNPKDDNKTQKYRNLDVESRISLLEYQFNKVVAPTLSRIEAKQDAAIRQIDTLKYVDQHEFDAYKDFAEKRYVSNVQNKSMTTLFWSMVTAVITGLIVVALNYLSRKP